MRLRDRAARALELEAADGAGDNGLDGDVWIVRKDATRLLVIRIDLDRA